MIEALVALMARQERESFKNIGWSDDDIQVYYDKKYPKPRISDKWVTRICFFLAFLMFTGFFVWLVGWGMFFTVMALGAGLVLFMGLILYGVFV